MKAIITIITVMFLFVSCTNREKDFEKVKNSISDDQMKTFVETISGDSFKGRMPFSQTEQKTIDFLAQELKNIGFEPAFGKSYFQEVPMVGISSQVIGEVTLDFASKWKYGLFQSNKISLRSTEDVAIHSSRPVEKIEIEEAEMVFCGFGIDAPEYGWNDFDGLSVKNKLIVVMINDPGLYSENNDKNFFNGRDLTYYGRWTYKFEEAARRGAVGVLIIHDDYGAGYGYSVASRSAQMTNLYINDPESLMNRCKIEGWISSDAASKIFLKLGYDLSELRSAAAKRGFKSFEMKTKFSCLINNTKEDKKSYNVAGILKGSSKSNETIIITGHWDHFGVVKNIIKSDEGKIDSIYNGAVDNATTMAWALEIGRSFKKLKHRQEHSVMILFPTAEEQGLLGSKYYVEHPAIPIDKTIACLNNDMMVPRGKMKDLMLIGYGYYPKLDSLYESAAKKQGRYVTSDPDARMGLFFRSDQFSFHNKGIPSSWAMGCYDSRENGKEWAHDSWNKFLKEVYHTTKDEYDPNWDWSGIIEDTQIAFEVAYRLCNE